MTLKTSDLVALAAMVLSAINITIYRVLPDDVETKYELYLYSSNLFILIVVIYFYLKERKKDKNKIN